MPITDVPASVYTLPFVLMNSLVGVEQTLFPSGDEAVNGPLELNDGGFPFGSSTQTQTWVYFIFLSLSPIIFQYSCV